MRFRVPSTIKQSRNATGVGDAMLMYACMHSKHNRGKSYHDNACQNTTGVGVAMLMQLSLGVWNFWQLLPVEMMVVERMAAYVYDTIGL